jgi:hypothetical protein
MIKPENAVLKPPIILALSEYSRYTATIISSDMKEV